MGGAGKDFAIRRCSLVPSRRSSVEQVVQVIGLLNARVTPVSTKTELRILTETPTETARYDSVFGRSPVTCDATLNS